MAAFATDTGNRGVGIPREASLPLSHNPLRSPSHHVARRLHIVWPRQWRGWSERCTHLIAEIARFWRSAMRLKSLSSGVPSSSPRGGHG